jgi:tetratricopeptide (TPR) repeat protein
VTSRNQLVDLVALDGAEPLPVDFLDRDEARQLLANRLGDDRLGADPGVVDEIITRCARLPLALAIIAARAGLGPGTSLDLVVGQLRRAGAGLDPFTGEGRGTDLRAVFSWSYRQLTPDAAAFFRRLGPHPGPDIAVPAAAALGGVPVGRVRPLLAELTRANLLIEPVPGRHTFHDLLRTYATELADELDTADDRRAAFGRLLDHYLHTAHAAATLLVPQRDPIPLEPAAPGAGPQPLDTLEQALDWLAAERSVLVATVERAVELGFDRHVRQLAWALTVYFARQGHCDEWAATQHAALRAAARTGDRAGQADAHRALVRAYGRLGREADAETHFLRADALFAELGDDVGHAHLHINLAHMLNHRGRHHEALYHNRQALKLYRVAGHRRGEADALNNVGYTHGLLGEHRENLEHSRQALAMIRRLGARAYEVNTLDSMGHAHTHLGHHREAVSCLEQALDLVRRLGDRYNEAEILDHLGDAHDAAGQPDAAHRHWGQALAILDEIDHPEADMVRAKARKRSSGEGDLAIDV